MIIEIKLAKPTKIFVKGIISEISFFIDDIVVDFLLLKSKKNIINWIIARIYDFKSLYFWFKIVASNKIMP